MMIELVVFILLFIAIILLILLSIRQNKQLFKLENNFTLFKVQIDERTQAINYTQQNLQGHLTEQLMKSFDNLRGQLISSMEQNTKQSDKYIIQLTQRTSEHLQQISQQVEKRLHEGFEKTTLTFQDILKRLTLIDAAQKRIAELSTNVINLQEILNDKRARGAFGEIQLNDLVSNILPSNSYALQYALSNDKRVDCALFLPQPNGKLCIDAKFPLENYQRMVAYESSDATRKIATQQFKQDVKLHLKTIAEKYIISQETADSALMFIPAESVFAEIHAHHPDLVAESQRLHVWITSPTTLMAILTTARAVLKDDATRKQIHIIQEHLVKLAIDFNRFQTRMDKLSTHIKQAHQDVDEANTSARKISSRFAKIEQVELQHTSELN